MISIQTRAALCGFTLFLTVPAGLDGPMGRGGSRTAPTGAGAAMVATGRKGLVTCSSAPATRAGLRILEGGGNAVDAAVAVGLAMAVTYPAAGNLGGGGFMIVRMKDGRSAAIDFREMAPGRAHRDMYLDDKGQPVPFASLVGYRAAGVPGTVAGFDLALRKFGIKPWRELVEPAWTLAADGFALSNTLARELAGAKVLEPFAESRRVFQRGGDYFRAGENFQQPDLAATLKRLQEDGPREFYVGKTARLIAADMAANGGLITLDDLRNYKAILRKPIRGTYRDFEIITMPPPSSGGIALIQMLNILEDLNFQSYKKDSPQRFHLMIEAMRRAFADRAQFLGDIDFVSVPWRGLTAKAYARDLAKTIDAERATPSPTVSHGRPLPFESPQTTHYSVVDSAGNAVAVTYTLNFGYGSGVTVKGAGFLLNNEMDDFASRPGYPNQFGLVQGEANAIAPRKRPLSSMTPTIVLKDGKLVMVLGSPGGPTIINTVLQVLTNAVDLGMNPEEAVRAPRIHHQWLPDRISYERSLPESVRTALLSMGHIFKDRPDSLGDVQAIFVGPDGIRTAVSDPRSPDGLALSQ